MTRVMAQGVFDLLHPGHLHYLRASRALGDELHVVIARDSRVGSEKDLVMHEESRRMVVDALEMVDAAILGSEDSIFDSVAAIDPDIITLGYDQEFDPDELEAMLDENGFPAVRVERIEEREGDYSSTQLRERLNQ